MKIEIGQTGDTHQHLVLIDEDGKPLIRGVDYLATGDEAAYALNRSEGAMLQAAARILSNRETCAELAPVLKATLQEIVGDVRPARVDVIDDKTPHAGKLGELDNRQELEGLAGDVELANPTWQELKDREKGESVLIVGPSPSVKADLAGADPFASRILMNFAPLATGGDYWVRGDDDWLKSRKLRILTAQIIGEVRSWEKPPVGLIAEGGSPWMENAFQCRFTSNVRDKPDRDPFEMLAGLGMPRGLGTLGMAVGLAVWLGAGEIVLAGCAFEPQEGRIHFYDDAPEGEADFQDQANSAQVFRDFFTNLVRTVEPWLQKRGIKLRYTEPKWNVQLRENPPKNARRAQAQQERDLADQAAEAAAKAEKGEDDVRRPSASAQSN